MNASETEIVNLVDQVQIAHRLCAGFYRRLLMELTKVAADAEFPAFWEWEPAVTNRPARSSVDPNSKWAWDMLPMFAASFWYKRFDAGAAAVGDASLAFHIYIDENFKKERRIELGIRGEPDAILLPRGSATVDIALHRCVAANGQTFADLWQEGRKAKSVSDEWTRCTEQLEVRQFHVSLASFLANPAEVSGRIKDAMHAA